MKKCKCQGELKPNGNVFTYQFVAYEEYYCKNCKEIKNIRK